MAFKGEIPIKNKYKSPTKQKATDYGQLFQMGVGLVEGFGAMSQRGDLNDKQSGYQKAYNAERQAYLDLDTSNPYAGMRNYFAGMQNTMEDLTINQQEADFMKYNVQQTSANIMQSLKGAAGGSGVAGLAQAMSNQSAINSAKSAASIGQQERANVVAKASQQAALNKLEASGADAVQTAQRLGEVWSRNAKADRQEFLLQEAGSNLANANLAIAQNKANIQAGFAKATGAFMQRASEIEGTEVLSTEDKGYFQLGGVGDRFGYWLKQFIGGNPNVSDWGTEAERKALHEQYPDIYNNE